MKARNTVSNIPWTFCRTPFPSSGTDEDGIATPDVYPGLFFPRLEFFWIDRATWFQNIHPPQARDVDQNASCNEAILKIGNRQLRTPVDGDGIVRKAVVQLALMGEMTQCIKVGVCISVVGDRPLVTNTRPCVIQPAHRHGKWAWVVDGLVSFDVVRERYRYTILD